MECTVEPVPLLSARKTLLKYAQLHPVRFVFLAALIIRIPVWIAISFFFDGHLFGDDLLYLDLVEDYGNNGGAFWSSYQTELWNRSLSFLLPAGILTKIIGFHPFVILFGSVLVGSAVAAFLTQLAKNHVSHTVAVVAGLAFAVMPSQVLWSSLLLKDSYIALGVAAMAFVLVQKSRTGLTFYALNYSLIFVLLMYVQRIRAHTLMVVCLALVLTALLSSKPQKILRTFFAICMLALMPWLINGDLGGLGYIETLAGGMEDQRLAGAVGANTAVVDVSTTLVPSTPSTPSTATRLLEEVKYLPSGLKVMLLDPTVTQLGNSRSLYLPFAEHIIWYPALLLAIYGALKTRKWGDDLLLAGFLFLGSTTMWSLTEGNFGTAYRHRSEFVWVVFLFAAIGTQNILTQRNNKKVKESSVSE